MFFKSKKRRRGREIAYRRWWRLNDGSKRMIFDPLFRQFFFCFIFNSTLFSIRALRDFWRKRNLLPKRRTVFVKEKI